MQYHFHMTKSFKHLFLQQQYITLDKTTSEIVNKLALLLRLSHHQGIGLIREEENNLLASWEDISSSMSQQKPK